VKNDLSCALAGRSTLELGVSHRQPTCPAVLERVLPSVKQQKGNLGTLEKVSIRRCTIGDETALSLLGQATFLESFAGMLDGNDILAHCSNQHSASVYLGWLTQDAYRVWIAEVQPGNAPVGYLVLAPPNLPIANPQAGDLEIKRIYLLAPFQGTGIGKRLMQEALAHARHQNSPRLLLGVHSRNTDAIAFYQKLNYKIAGERKFKVGNNEYDDLVLALDI